MLDAGGTPRAISLVLLRRAESDGRSSRMDRSFYDALEAREPAEREAALMAALPQVIAAARRHAPAYRDPPAPFRPQDITHPRAPAALPGATPGREFPKPARKRRAA